MSQEFGEEGSSTFEVSTSTVPVTRVYQQVKQELLVITKDRAHLVLMRDCQHMEKKDRWLVPLGALIPIAATLVTTDFVKRFSLPGSVWGTIFVLGAIGCVLWIVMAFRSRGQSIGPDEMLDHLFEGATEVTQNAIVPRSDRSNSDGRPFEIKGDELEI